MTMRIKKIIILVSLFVLVVSCIKPRYPTGNDMSDMKDKGTRSKVKRELNGLQSPRIEIPIQVSNKYKLKTLEKTGFCVGYSEELKIPLWVAWELTEEEVGGDCPREDFTEDPTVEQQAEHDDYRGSGWSRGHMAPAADMKWSVQAMHDCCMMTNICPQKAELNTGSWSKLEEKCRRTYARNYGKVYIVCGPVVDDDFTTIGHNLVAVPYAFYKVLLVLTSEGWQAVGFVYHNNEGPHNMRQAACTVDEVEILTGLDFFSTLPDNIEENIEANYNWTYWM